MTPLAAGDELLDLQHSIPARQKFSVKIASKCLMNMINFQPKI